MFLLTSINLRRICFLGPLFFNCVHGFGAEPIMPKVRCNFYSTMGYFTDINSTQFITTASNSAELSKVNLYISPVTSERLEVLQTSK